MKLLPHDAGSYDILRITPNAIQHIEECGRTCYRSEHRITQDSAKKFVEMIMKSGHHSVIEHASATVRFKDVSRGFTHELVRHRLCAFSQQSTRYVDPAKKDGFKIICGPNMSPDNSWFQKHFQYVEDAYKSMLDSGYKKDEARQLLPIAIANEIVVSANLREWRHIFTMRCSKKAHWEIRRLMRLLLAEMSKLVPIIFDDLVKEYSE